MGIERREFLKFLGISAASLGTASAITAVAGETGSSAARTPTKAEMLSPNVHWAMVVIMDKLTDEDCRNAVNACHLVHNVPDIRWPDGSVNIKEEVKWIWMERYHNAFPDQAGDYPTEIAEEKEFPVLCNHCTDPPCVRVCPTKATFKRESDGIVVMDMHRCIGCRFCMAGCPYGSRSFNWGDPRPYIKKLNADYPTRTKGVVEKCNFCAERLFKGLQPACVEAVKSGALVFGDLNSPSSEVRNLLREHNAIRRKPSLGTGPNVFYII
jgi:Fe-S-cluster-containing dehydrogenase component